MILTIEFQQLAEQVLLADSRVRDFREPGYQLMTQRQGNTLPDLGESGELNDVQIYTGEAIATTA